jgi:hypothetical protein
MVSAAGSRQATVGLPTEAMEEQLPFWAPQEVSSVWAVAVVRAVAAAPTKPTVFLSVL